MTTQIILTPKRRIVSDDPLETLRDEGIAPRTPKYPKRIHARKCTRKLYLPSDDGRHYITINCTEPVHALGTPHKSSMMVFAPNGSGQRVGLTWTDMGIIEMRQLYKDNPNAKKTKSSSGRPSSGAAKIVSRD